MLHLCRYTRALSLQTYNFWPCSRFATHERLESKIYVNPGQDMFFFLGNNTKDFFLLSVVQEFVEEFEANADARLAFWTHTLAMRKLALSPLLWHELCRYNACWISADLPYLKEFTVTFIDPSQDPLTTPIDLYQERTISRPSVRYNYAIQMMIWSESDFPFAGEMVGDDTWEEPSLRFTDLSPENSNSSPKGDHALRYTMIENGEMFDKPVDALSLGMHYHSWGPFGLEYDI